MDEVNQELQAAADSLRADAETFRHVDPALCKILNDQADDMEVQYALNKSGPVIHLEECKPQPVEEVEILEPVIEAEVVEVYKPEDVSMVNGRVIEWPQNEPADDVDHIVIKSMPKKPEVKPSVVPTYQHEHLSHIMGLMNKVTREPIQKTKPGLLRRLFYPFTRGSLNPTLAVNG